ncbi:MAG: hypothetical protein WBY94_15820 [Polyangiaceae bacterium]
MSHKIRIFESIPLAAAIAACTSTTVNVPADAPAAQTAADITVATNYEASLAWAVSDPVPVGLFVLDATTAVTTEAVPGAAAASAAASATNQSFSPAGCVSASASGNVATFNLSKCTGPGGLSSATGTFSATFTPSSQGLQIQLAGSNISVNGANINVASLGVLTLGSDMVTKTFQANTTSSGTGPFGEGVARAGNYSLTWQSGSNCGTVNGSFADIVLDGGLESGVDGGPLDGAWDSGFEAGLVTTSNGGRASTTNVINYVRCRAQCPQSGTTTRNFANGTVTITYNGSSSVPWSGSNGNAGTLNLNCP